MAIAILTVRATITPEREEAFNHWYNTEHIPQLLRYPGAAGARRYKQIEGDDKYQFITIYEFESEETYQSFVNSTHFAEMIEEYNVSFGAASERVRNAYVQVWP